jgi:uncharacterized protein YndB with AHSA1/START domain
MDVRAPAALVFAVLSTPERLPEWNTSVQSARRADPAQPIGPGARAVFKGRFMGQVLESETEVVVFEPPRRFATHAVRGPRLHTSFDLAAQPFGTRVNVEVTGEVPGGRLGAVFAEGFLRGELVRSLQRLELLCEREATERAANEPIVGGDPACWLQLDESASE